MIEFDLSFSDVTSNVPGRVLFNTKTANWEKIQRDMFPEHSFDFKSFG